MVCDTNLCNSSELFEIFTQTWNIIQLCRNFRHVKLAERWVRCRCHFNLQIRKKNTQFKMTCEFVSMAIIHLNNAAGSTIESNNFTTMQNRSGHDRITTRLSLKTIKLFSNEWRLNNFLNFIEKCTYKSIDFELT